MHFTPEKKRVTWKPMIEEVHSSVLGVASNCHEEPRHSRCNLMKDCDNLLGISDQADVSIESLQNHSAEVFAVSEKSIALKGTESMSREEELAISDIASNPALRQAIIELPIEEVPMQGTISIGGLSEEAKHAGMKRRYLMLQQNLKIPVEQERRLKRERLRNLIPVWSKKRADEQLLHGCMN
jgi:hypothetical protein